MIYTNFLYVLIAIGMISLAPVSSGQAFLPDINLLLILLLLMGFWVFNRTRFLKLKSALDRDAISLMEARRRYMNMVNFHMIGALILFGIEIFRLDLKWFLVIVPHLGEVETFVSLFGLLILVLHLSIVWYWGYRAFGRTFSLGNTPWDYLQSNLKFNLVIIFPWLFFLILQDLLTLLVPQFLLQLEASPFYHGVFFGGFLIFLMIIGPVLFIRFWDCKRLDDNELRESIDQFSRSQKVKFKSILSWNALNRGLITAGVMGIIYPFRYFLITPELMNILDKEELMGVASHEVGHVKKKHLVFYMAFLIFFMFIGQQILGWVVLVGIKFLPLSSLGLYLNYYTQFFLFMLILVLFFRFVFGYFMRNFERQADMYCFECGVNPEWLIRSFIKLGFHLGDDGKKSNWHHYNITQRIEFLRECMTNPITIKRHQNKLRRSLTLFVAVMIIIGIVSISSPDFLNYNTLVERVLADRLQQNPDDPALLDSMGQLYFQVGKWKESKEAFERSLKLDAKQPDVINNLAWLLLTCPDKNYLNPKRALQLAKDAAQLKQTCHIMDTLAEAYFQNDMYKEAYIASESALMIATDNIDYYKKQKEKMYSHYRRFKNMIKI